MSDLLSSLRLASRALDAQHRGLEATGQNIANVNTPGYTRRVVDFVSVAPADNRSAGLGVDVSGIRNQRDRLLDRRLQQELPSERREAAIAENLSVIEASLGAPGASIDANLSAFFDAFSSLAEDPQSSVARNEALLQGQSLADGFRTMSTRLISAQNDTDLKIRTAVEEINTLTAQIASINKTMAGAGDGQFVDLQDKQAELVRQLSEKIDIHVLERPTGGVDITFGNGRPMVVADTQYSLSATSTPPSGFAALVAGGTTVTSEVTGGTLGGLLQVRDVTLPSYITRLDQLAYDVVSQVNAIHTAGFTQTGAAAGDFFAPLASATGAAAAMAVDPTIVADTSLIAAGSTANAGDNATAKALAGLRDAKVLNGGTATLTDSWGQLVYRVGRDAQAAKQEQVTRSSIVRQVDELRDQVSGISLDEEAMQMMKFQRAYEANARFFSAVSQTLDVLMQALH